MARRRSPWQQFADNFKATNDTFNKFFTAKETAEIMDDEITTIQAPDAGIGPHSSGATKFMYGGQSYDKQITPAQLTGLRNARIADVMTKYGDSKGAMQMLTNQANLTNLGLDTKLKEGTLAENIRKVKLDNDAKVKNMDLTQAQINRYNTLTPLEGQKYLAEIERTKQQTAESRAKMPSELTILESEADIAAQKAREFTDETSIDVRQGLEANKKTKDDLEVERLQREGKIAESKYGFDLAAALLNSEQGYTQAQANLEATKLILKGNETLSTFAEMMGNGSFESPEAQKAWLQQNWNGDKRVLDMINTIDANQLSQITAEGTKLMAQVDNAFTGKSQNAAKEAIIKVIDMQDGMKGNMYFDNRDGKIQLIEKDGDGQLNIIAEGKNWNDFKETFYAEFTPLKSLEIAKSNADRELVLAQAAKYNAEAVEPPRDYTKEKWQSMVTQFMSSNAFLEAQAESPEAARAALQRFKDQFNSDPEDEVGLSKLPEGVTVTQTN